MKTNKSFHFLRDHPDQGTYILGGGWGWRATPLTRKAWSQAWKAALKDPLSWAGRREVGPDQTWLTRYTTRSIIKNKKIFTSQYLYNLGYLKLRLFDLTEFIV